MLNRRLISRPQIVNLRSGNQTCGKFLLSQKLFTSEGPLHTAIICTYRILQSQAVDPLLYVNSSLPLQEHSCMMIYSQEKHFWEMIKGPSFIVEPFLTMFYTINSSPCLLPSQFLSYYLFSVITKYVPSL